MSRLKELQERGGLAAAAAAAAAAASTVGSDHEEPNPYTSRNTGQPVTMDLCVVCGDRASGGGRREALAC